MDNASNTNLRPFKNDSIYEQNQFQLCSGLLKDLVFGVKENDNKLISHITFDYRALETIREIQKQKNTGESKIQGASVGRRRKSKRCIHFDKIESDITNYKVIFLISCLCCY